MTPKKPAFCDLIVTENCMLECKMCRMWQSGKNTAGPAMESWMGFIDSFARFVDGRAQVQFVGGEPLLKPGILSLIRYAVKKGLSTTMTTNGYLIDRRMAAEIADSGLNTLVFSLDSLDRKTHDFLRGRDGVYDRLMQAMALLGGLKDDRLKVHVVTTIMQPNLQGLAELAEWVNRQACIDQMSFQAIMQPFFTPFDHYWYKTGEFAFLWPNDAKTLDRALDGLTSLKNKGAKITNPLSQLNVFREYFKRPEKFVRNSDCHLGYNSVSVNTSGDIFLCLSQEPIGNIVEANRMEDIWLGDKADRVRKNIKHCKNNCKLMINCFFEEEPPVSQEKESVRSDARE